MRTIWVVLAVIFFTAVDQFGNGGALSAALVILVNQTVRYLLHVLRLG